LYKLHVFDFEVGWVCIESSLEAPITTDDDGLGGLRVNLEDDVDVVARSCHGRVGTADDGDDGEVTRRQQDAGIVSNSLSILREMLTVSSAHT